MARDPYRCIVLCIEKDPSLVEHSPVAVSKFFILLDQRALHFGFVLDTDGVVAPSRRQKQS